MNLFNYIRSRFKQRHRYTHTYKVSVHLQHPQIVGGSILKCEIYIDAESKDHARRRLKDELIIVVGSARKF